MCDKETGYCDSDARMRRANAVSPSKASLSDDVISRFRPLPKTSRPWDKYMDNVAQTAGQAAASAAVASITQSIAGEAEQQGPAQPSSS